MTIKDDTRRTRQSSLGWMIQRITRALDEQMNARLAQMDMNVTTFAVMMTVLEQGPLNQSEIGARFGAPAYAISRALDTLERLGFVERRAHASSRRAHHIHATPAGEALAPRLHAIVREVNAELMAPLSSAERAQFATLLERVLPGRDKRL